MSQGMAELIQEQPLSQVRAELARGDGLHWHRSMGAGGDDYFQVWKV